MRVDFDRTYRLGRCNRCKERPAFAWPARSGLRLDDVRCPRCDGLLDATSREVMRLRPLEPYEVDAMREAAIARVSDRIEEYAFAVAGWVADCLKADADGDEAAACRCNLNAERYERLAGEAGAALARLEKGFALRAAEVLA